MIDHVILDTIDNGIILLEEDLTISAWNKWLEIYTNKSQDEVVGKNICDLFEYINKSRLQRKIKSVLVTNNPSFYSIDPHHFLIDIPISNITNKFHTSMQQNITIVPYNLDKKQVMIYIYNNTSLCETNIKLQKLNSKLEEMSHRDPLTNLFNRRYFKEESEKIQSFSKRNNFPLSIIMLDIDNFKIINDKYGHYVGDDVIIKISRILEEIIRNSDIIARFGGEEFVVLLQNSKESNTINVANKLKDSIQQSDIILPDGEVLKFTASFGVAQFDEKIDDNNLEHTISRADDALYEAKRSGKNRVIFKSI